MQCLLLKAHYERCFNIVRYNQYMLNEEKLRTWYAGFSTAEYAPRYIPKPILQTVVEVPSLPVRKWRRDKQDSGIGSSSHRFYSRAYSANQRAEKRGIKQKLTALDLQAVYDRDNGICVLCNSAEDFQFDHIVPLCKQGDNTVDNLRVLCATCNFDKLCLEDYPDIAPFVKAKRTKACV